VYKRQGLKKLEKYLNNNRNSRSAIKAEILWGYNADLTKKIYSFLSDRYYIEGKISTRIRDVLRYTNKCSEDVFPCLFFLERMGLILVVMKNKIYKRIYFLRKGKNLKDALPPLINYNSIFDTQEFLKEFLSKSQPNQDI